MQLIFLLGLIAVGLILVSRPEKKVNERLGSRLPDSFWKHLSRF